MMTHRPSSLQAALELAPRGSVSDGKRTWIARSFGKLLKLFEVKERLHARSATIHHRAHLGAVLCPSSQEKRGPSARLPPTSHPQQGSLREAGASLGVR